MKTDLFVPHPGFQFFLLSNDEVYILYCCCLIISKRITAVATEAFRESRFLCMGIVMRKSHCFLTSGRIPLPSPPITRQMGPEKSDR